MGYNTDFSGRVAIEPPLDQVQVLFLRDFASHDHRETEYEDTPGFYCQWVPTKDGAALEWDGSEKFYDSVEWMRYLIDNFVAGGVHKHFTETRKVNGAIMASGDDPDDVWRLIVTDNVVTVERPSWG